MKTKVLLFVVIMLVTTKIVCAQKSKTPCSDDTVFFNTDHGINIEASDKYYNYPYIKIRLCPSLLPENYFKGMVLSRPVWPSPKWFRDPNSENYDYASVYFNSAASTRFYSDSAYWAFKMYVWKYPEVQSKIEQTPDRLFPADYYTLTFPFSHLPDTLKGKAILNTRYPYHKHLALYYNNFYFKQTEVTNWEYREFYKWVIDSTIRTLTGVPSSEETWMLKPEEAFSADNNPELILNKTFDSAGFVTKLKDFMLKYTLKNAYLFKDGRLFVDKEKIIYGLHLPNGIIKKVMVSPDINCFSHDFKYAFWSSFEYNYFTSQEYRDYPVVGINWFQARAYCNWKTIQLNEQLRKEHPDLYLIVDLPSEIEWERVCLADENLFSKHHMESLADYSWTTDLQLSDSVRMQPGNPRNYTHTWRDMPWNNSMDGYYYQNPAELSHVKFREGSQANQMLSNLTSTGISGLSNNVSEWMLENYQDNWKLAFEARQSRLDTSKTPEARLIQHVETYYNNQCDTNGYLVRGANWYDERYHIVYGRNKAGANAKTFVDPNKSFSTLGFRYVIHVYKRNGS